MTAAPVDLIIPDSGPLISLAHANRLDLIEVFDRPIIIADIVKLECLKKPTAPDFAVLERWFSRIGNRARVVDTPMREPYEAALQRERAGETRATSGFGDATLSFMLRRLDDYATPGSIPLVLIEDENASKLLARYEQAHVLSTRTWLISLERAGVIPSAGRYQRDRAWRTLPVRPASGSSGRQRRGQVGVDQSTAQPPPSDRR